MAESVAKTITIDGKKYPLADLAESTRAKIMNMQFVDAEIGRARNQMVMLQAARKEFARQLQEELPEAQAANGEAES